VYGGRSGHVFLGDLWAFHFATHTWRELAPSGALEPGLRFAHAAAVATNGHMYVSLNTTPVAGYAQYKWRGFQG
jgi:hypothetical protein